MILSLDSQEKGGQSIQTRQQEKEFGFQGLYFRA